MATQYTAGITQGQVWSADIANQIGATWETWTPTVTQSGNVTLTVQYARYSRIQKTVIGQTYVQLTGTGTVSNDVIMSLPITAQASSNVMIGYGFFYDASAPALYTVVATLASATSVRFYTSPNGTGGAWGSNPAVALANNDQIRLQFNYEAA